MLADIRADELADAVYGRMAFLRATNRLFVLADPVKAKELIDDASRAAGPQARSCIDAFLTVYWAAMGKPQAAIETSGKFTWQELPDLVAQRVTAGPLPLRSEKRAAPAKPQQRQGRLPNSDTLVRHHHRRAPRRPTLAGHIADAAAPAETIRQRQIEFQAFQSFQVGSLAVGRAALGSGRLDAAISQLTQSIETVDDSTDSNGWGYRCRIPLTTALAMRGSTAEAAARLGALEKLRHPSWRYLDYEYAIAKAWLAAGQGAISEAIAVSLAAAETARSNRQFAPEVMCLQTATQFGERSCGPRLRELAAIVEGPRAGVAARFAEALHDDDGPN